MRSIKEEETIYQKKIIANGRVTEQKSKERHSLLKE